jgi:hypothetical protein
MECWSGGVTVQVKGAAERRKVSALRKRDQDPPSQGSLKTSRLINPLARIYNRDNSCINHIPAILTNFSAIVLTPRGHWTNPHHNYLSLHQRGNILCQTIRTGERPGCMRADP